MHRKFLGLCVLVTLGLGFVGAAKGDQGTVEVGGLSFYAWSWNLSEGDEISWDIRTDVDDVNLYITTYNDYRKAANLEQFSYYKRSPNIYADSGSFTVPFEGTWVLFVHNPNFKSVRVTYDINVTSPIIPGTGIPGLTMIPAIMGLGILGAVSIWKRKN